MKPGFLLLLALSVAAPLHAQTTRYTAQAVPVSGPLNNQSAIAGDADTLQLWKRGKVSDLGLPLGQDEFGVGGFNDRGEFAGSANPHKPSDNLEWEYVHLFLWSAGKYKEIGTAGNVHGMNNAGVVVGTKNWPDGQYGFVYAHGTMREVGGPKDGYLMLNGINNYGDMVGVTLRSESSKEQAMFDGKAILIRNGVQTTLPLPPGYEINLYNGPHAINDMGQVVYTSEIENDTLYLWSKGKFTRIGSLPGYERIGFTTLNNKGDIIGRCEHDAKSAPYQTFRPFLWRKGKIYDINSLLPPRSGWVLDSVSGLSDRGQISASGTHNGKPANCLLSPAVP